MIIEIAYTFQQSKDSPAIKSWTYFYVKTDNAETAKTKAKTYWKKFCNELGWKPRQAKLDHIEEIRNAQTSCPDFIVVSKSELPPARKRTSKASVGTPRVSRSSSPRKRTKKTKGV